MAFRRTPPLSFEGTREVLEEIAHGSPETPERRRMLQLMRDIEAARERRELEEKAAAER
jgi:hypothetical protein